MRNAWRFIWTLLVTLVTSSACGGATTAPTEPTLARFSIEFQLTNVANLSLSDPERCAGDAKTCLAAHQPQGVRVGNASVVRAYALPSGTYRLTGVLEPTPFTDPSLHIRIGRSATGLGSGGVTPGNVLELVAFSGEPSPPVHVVAERCGGIFLPNPTGVLEWAMIFTVVDAAADRQEWCS